MCVRGGVNLKVVFRISQNAPGYSTSVSPWRHRFQLSGGGFLRPKIQHGRRVLPVSQLGRVFPPSWHNLAMLSEFPHMESRLNTGKWENRLYLVL